MRIIVITDPPTSVQCKRRGDRYFGGTYTAIPGMTNALQVTGHMVSTYILLEDGRAVEEKTALEQVHLDQLNTVPMFTSTIGLDEAISANPPEAIILLLKRQTLEIHLRRIFALVRGIDAPLMLFVVTSRTYQSQVERLASESGIDVKVAGKPGVARIPTKALDQITSCLVRINSGEGQS